MPRSPEPVERHKQRERDDKDRDRKDKDRNREKDKREKEKERNKDREKERDHGKVKENGHSHSREKDRDKGQKVHKDKERRREGKEKKRSREGDKDKDRDRKRVKGSRDKARENKEHRSKDSKKPKRAPGSKDSKEKKEEKKKPKPDNVPGSAWWQLAQSDSDDDMDEEEREAKKRLEESRRRRAQILAKHEEKKEGSSSSTSSSSSDSSSSEDEEEIKKQLAANKQRVAKEEWRKREAEEEKRLQELEEKRKQATEGAQNEKQNSKAEDQPHSEKKQIFDMFSNSPTNLAALKTEVAAPDQPQLTTEMQKNLHDNWDDAEGYYSFRAGEILGERYKVMGKYGRGVFSVVCKCEVVANKKYDKSKQAASDLLTDSGAQAVTALKYDQPVGSEVAVKVIRANDHMYKTGVKEMEILKLLAEGDPNNKKACVRYIDHFEHKNHLCIVFEPLEMNMRELLKKYGKDQGKEVGISIEATRLYAKQLLVALKHMRDNRILHADLKPDNVLVNGKKTVIKLADFGSACFTDEINITPYLVSRYYRPPEVILGLHYDCAVDMWAVAATVYELYTGKVMFPGRTNNDMLRKFMDLRGRFPNKMLKKAAFKDDHFNDQFQFKCKEIDPVSKKEITRMRTITGATRNLKQLLLDAADPSDDRRKIIQMSDFLEKALTLDPAQRLRPEEALKHPFVTEK